jgi:hypothetical protein
MDKITAVGQKGYSEKKYCQEVLITLVETVKKCERNKIRGALVSLDIKKAFDSISHSFLVAALKFFNFGDKFIHVIKTLCTNRTAKVILEYDRLSKSFRLEQGNAQGDTISPFLFNICYQILILKINTDLQIESIIDLPAIPEQHRPLPDTVSTRPRIALACADDCTVATTLKKKNLDRLKAILDDFSSISGLECNIEKSHLLPIGEIVPIPAEIANAGFEIKDKVTVLGLTFTGSGNILEDQEQIIIGKVKQKVTFWSRFNLSLPGRIDIAKSMMYSQTNYLGCFLPFSERFITCIESQISNFVRGPLRIGEKKIFSKVEMGGSWTFSGS